jgi:hypothetical protein
MALTVAPEAAAVVLVQQLQAVLVFLVKGMQGAIITLLLHIFLAAVVVLALLVLLV